MAFAPPGQQNKKRRGEDDSKEKQPPLTLHGLKGVNLDLIFGPPRSVRNPIRHLEQVKEYFHEAGLPIPYNLDGNADYYSEANMIKRESLRTNSQILHRVNQFWLCFDTIEGCITCSQYVATYLKLARALYGKFDYSQCKESAFREWHRDLARVHLKDEDDRLNEHGSVELSFTYIIHIPIYCLIIMI